MNSLCTSKSITTESILVKKDLFLLELAWLVHRPNKSLFAQNILVSLQSGGTQ